MKPGKGGQLARSAGAYATNSLLVTVSTLLSVYALAKYAKYLADCRATIGEVGNAEHMLRQLR